MPVEEMVSIGSFKEIFSGHVGYVLFVIVIEYWN